MPILVTRECVKSLIQADADLNTQDHMGWIALMRATLLAYFDNVQILIQQEVNPF